MDTEEVVLDLEDGEIESGNDSDSLLTYVPLERPSNYAADVPQKRFPVNQQYSDSEEEVQSESDDSDSDAGMLSSKKPKRKKLQPKPKPLQKSDKLKKYDIWSARAQEDVLTETLNSCDVTLKDRSRSVESYDFSLARKYWDEIDEKEGKQQQGNKRTRDDRRNNHFKPRRRSKSNENKSKSTPRVISDLTVNVSECDNAEIARDIANKLCEEREDLILKVLTTVGKDRTFEFFNDTRRVEKDGGMLIMNGMRRRTPGGVFLFLVRSDDHITLDEKNAIFDEDKRKYKEKLKEERKAKKKAMKQKISGSKKPKPKPNLPELLTRADLITKGIKPAPRVESEGEADGQNCTNPPPTPESDQPESWDAMDSPPRQQTQTEDTSLEETRGKLKSYDDDFLDIGGANDMELF